MRFSVNRGFVNKSPANKQCYATGYEDVQGTADDLIAFIADGHAFSACYDGGQRSKGNFVRSDIIALDFDGGKAEHGIERITSERPFVQSYASFAYTTPSHTPEAPRCRVVFELENSIRDADDYELVVGEMLNIFSDADQACKDASRLFYGNSGAEFIVLGKTLPTSVVDSLRAKAVSRKEEATKPTSDVEVKIIADNDSVSRYVRRAVESQIGILGGCLEGNRHNELLVSALRMFSLVKSDWVNGIITKGQVESMLIDAATSNGLVRDDGMASVTKTIADAFEMATSREMPNLRLSTAVQVSNFTADDMQRAYVLGMHRAMSPEWKRLLYSVIPAEYAEMHVMSMNENGLTIPYWTDITRTGLSNIQHGLMEPEFELDGFPVMNIQLEQNHDRCLVVGSVNGAVSIGHNCRGLSWDVLACPMIDKLPYIGEVLFNYQKVVFVSSASAPISEANHLGIKGARYLQLQVEPQELFGTWNVGERYFADLIKTSWI